MIGGSGRVQLGLDLTWRLLNALWTVTERLQIP